MLANDSSDEQRPKARKEQRGIQAMEYPGDSIVESKVLIKKPVLDKEQDAGNRPIISDLRVNPRAGKPAGNVLPLGSAGCQIEISYIFVWCGKPALLRLGRYRYRSNGLIERHVKRQAGTEDNHSTEVPI